MRPGVLGARALEAHGGWGPIEKWAQLGFLPASCRGFQLWGWCLCLAYGVQLDPTVLQPPAPPYFRAPQHLPSPCSGTWVPALLLQEGKSSPDTGQGGQGGQLNWLRAVERMAGAMRWMPYPLRPSLTPHLLWGPLQWDSVTAPAWGRWWWHPSCVSCSLGKGQPFSRVGPTVRAHAHAHTHSYSLLQMLREVAHHHGP